MSFSEDVYFVREIDTSFSLEIMLSGETAIPVTVTVTPMEISEAFSQTENSLRATGKFCLSIAVAVWQILGHASKFVKLCCM